MLRQILSLPAIGALVLVTACAQPEPAPIMPEPIYGKYGEPVGCPVGRLTSTGECVPPEDCATAAGTADCLPDSTGRRVPGGSGAQGGRAPGTAGTAAGTT